MDTLTRKELTLVELALAGLSIEYRELLKYQQNNLEVIETIEDRIATIDRIDKIVKQALLDA